MIIIFVNQDLDGIILILSVLYYLIKNSQAVKKVCGSQKGYGEKRCEIQGGGKEMAVMVGTLYMVVSL